MSNFNYFFNFIYFSLYRKRVEIKKVSNIGTVEQQQQSMVERDNCSERREMNELSGTIYGTKRLEFSTTWDLGEASTSRLGLGVLAAQPTNPQCRIDERVRDETTSIFFFSSCSKLLVLHFTIDRCDRSSRDRAFSCDPTSPTLKYIQKSSKIIFMFAHKICSVIFERVFLSAWCIAKLFVCHFTWTNKQGGDEVAECNAIFRKLNYNVFSSVTTDMDLSYYYFRFWFPQQCRIFSQLSIVNSRSRTVNCVRNERRKKTQK